MSVVCIVFLCALVLGAAVLAWIAYCMFYRERHQSEKDQINIDDLRHQNMVTSPPSEVKEKTITGIFVLPTRRKHKDEEYSKRPDYPESPAPNVQRGTEELVAMYSEGLRTDDAFPIDTNSPIHSDV